jgi:hypothetical protein
VAAVSVTNIGKLERMPHRDLARLVQRVEAERDHWMLVCRYTNETVRLLVERLPVKPRGK